MQRRPDAELACVVMSVGSPPHLLDAVRSLLAQDEPVEIIVVNSGGGDPEGLVRAAGTDVPVVSSDERLYPGAARNVGIARTRAPYVAFLASDCLAEAGWARGRLRAHRAGAHLVSCAMTNPDPWKASAVASHVLLFPRRLPRTPPTLWLHYGASYVRSLFERYGPFREDLRTGEDTEFRQRLGPDVVQRDARDVRTAHRHPGTLVALIGDQYRRGGRTVRAYRMLWGAAGATRAVREITGGLVPAVRAAWQASLPRDRWPLILSLGHATLATAAAAIGARLDSAAREADAPTRTPGLHALLVCRNEMPYLPGYIENVAPHVDGILALDDGSTDGSAEFLESRPSVLELIRVPPREPHVPDESGHRRRLLEAAGRHRVDWLIALDADERVERHFRVRALSAIGWAERHGVAACAVTRLELWNGPDRYRSDGNWATQTRGSLFRWRPTSGLDPGGSRGIEVPRGATPAGGAPPVDVIVYHLGTLRPEDRRARRWPGEDQAPGHTDTAGVRLERLPVGRDYVPREDAPTRDPGGVDTRAQPS